MNADTQRSNQEEKWKKTRVRLAVIVLVAAVAMAMLAQHVRYQELGYEILSLERERRGVLDEIGRIEIERAFYKSPGRIGEIARENGMVRPPRDAIRIIEVEE